MILQPCEVILTCLGWGPSNGAVVRHVRQYEGVTKVRVEGYMAMVQFINLDWVDMGASHSGRMQAGGGGDIEC